MDTDWIKAAATQVRTTIRQAINKVDRIGNGNGNARCAPTQALDDTPDIRTEAAPQAVGGARQPLGAEHNFNQEQTP